MLQATIVETTLNFDDGIRTEAPTLTWSWTLIQYAEQGYTLTPIGEPPFGGAGPLTIPTFEIKRGALYNNADYNEGIHFARSDGGSFTLIDLEVLNVIMPMMFLSPTGARVEFTSMEWFQRIQGGGSNMQSFGYGWQDIPYFDFVAGEGNDAPVIIDNARLGAVPEPSTLLLLCSGLAGLGGIAWRRRRR